MLLFLLANALKLMLLSSPYNPCFGTQLPARSSATPLGSLRAAAFHQPSGILSLPGAEKSGPRQAVWNFWKLSKFPGIFGVNEDVKFGASQVDQSLLCEIGGVGWDIP